MFLPNDGFITFDTTQCENFNMHYIWRHLAMSQATLANCFGNAIALQVIYTDTGSVSQQQPPRAKRYIRKADKDQTDQDAEQTANWDDPSSDEETACDCSCSPC